MKVHCVSGRQRLMAFGFLLGIGLLVGSPVSAQNLLNNPSFEDLIATNASAYSNWVVKYVYGTPDDFCIRDRSTFGHHAGTFGGHFRPVTEGPMHAYFTQTAVGLQTGANYVVSGWMMVTWQSGAQDGKMNVYIESIGGLGSVRTPNCTSADSTWTFYSVTNTPKANGTLEVRLHYDRPTQSSITDNKGLTMASGCFDDLSVTHQ